MAAEAACSVRLPAFEGPLDLLLHLIRVNEINIYDIPIVEITRQYDAYLALMRELDLHVAGEYLVMAATLVHIKSRMLLPRPPAGAGADADPRAELVRQLVEFEQLRAAAEALRGLEEARADVFLRAGDPLAPFQGESLLAVSLFDLLTAFKAVLERIDAARALEIEPDEISIAEMQAWILSSLSGGGEAPFLRLLAERPSRAERVVAFLALLELIRLGSIVARQREQGGEILLALRPGAPDLAGDAPGEASGA